MREQARHNINAVSTSVVPATKKNNAGTGSGL